MIQTKFGRPTFGWQTKFGHQHLVGLHEPFMAHLPFFKKTAWLTFNKKVNRKPRLRYE